MSEKANDETHLGMNDVFSSSDRYRLENLSEPAAWHNSFATAPGGLAVCDGFSSDEESDDDDEYDSIGEEKMIEDILCKSDSMLRISSKGRRVVATSKSWKMERPARTAARNRRDVADDNDEEEQLDDLLIAKSLKSSDSRVKIYGRGHRCVRTSHNAPTTVMKKKPSACSRKMSSDDPLIAKLLNRRKNRRAGKQGDTIMNNSRFQNGRGSTVGKVDLNKNTDKTKTIEPSSIDTGATKTSTVLPAVPPLPPPIRSLASARTA